jgi:ribosomal protein S18 acetylase RimI-like enzyme
MHQKIHVAPEFRGQGVGRVLVDAALNRARELCCCEVEVTTETSNHQAREFYRRCGFDEEGVLFELHFPADRGRLLTSEGTAR